MTKLTSLSALAAGLALVGCATPPSTELDGTSWRSQSQMSADEGTSAQEATASLAFAEGQVSGSTGCNRFWASYRIEGNQLTVEEMAVTERACMGAAGELEKQFVELFAQPVAFEVLSSGDLAVTRHPDLSLTFEPEE